MEWALSLLLNNPEALVKARAEIDVKFERSRLMEESKLAKFPYLRAIVYETLSMCPVAPLLVPHELSEKCTVGGYSVPRGTMLLVTMWTIQNNPEEPEEFRPERFQGLQGGRDGFRFWPFGAGRRGFPGEALAMCMVCLALGLLIQRFDWERTDDELVDMSGGPGLNPYWPSVAHAQS